MSPRSHDVRMIAEGFIFIHSTGNWETIQEYIENAAALAPRPRAAAIDPRIYEAYTGQYEIGSGRTFTVRKEGERLKAQTTGRATGELIPKSETEFTWFNPEMNVPAVAEVIFIKDETGKVTHAVFRRDGQEAWRAKKNH